MRTRLALLLCIAGTTVLGACAGGGGGGSLPSIVPNGSGNAGSSSSTVSHIVYFSSQGFNNPLLPATIWGFDGSGTGTQAPIRTIEDSAAANFQGLATDAAGDVYAAAYPPNSNVASIVEYAPGNDTQPVRTIVDSSQLQNIDQIAVTPDGTVFVLDSFAPPGCSGVPHLLVFSSTSNGNATPVRDITGTSTQLDTGILTVAADGTAYVGYISSSTPASTIGKILRFGPSANGNVAPSGIISGGDTHVGQIWQMATSSSALVVSSRQSLNSNSGDILEFPLDANGNVSPTKDITLAQSAVALALDSAGNYYAYGAKNQVSVFPPSATGSATPMNVFTPMPPPFAGCGSCGFLSPMAAH